MNQKKLLVLATIAIVLLVNHKGIADPVTMSSTETANSFQLRAYRGVRHMVEQRNQVTIHHFILDDTQHAGWFASKIYSDFALTVGNTLTQLSTPLGPMDAIDLNGQGIVAPLLQSGSSEVDVVTGATAGAVAVQVSSLTSAAPLRAADLSHPLYMDKWDRYCLGAWQHLNDYYQDQTLKTVPDYCKWLAQIGINPQILPGPICHDLTASDAPITWLRHYFDTYGVKYQWIEWLENSPDVYNRNPFLTKTMNPHVATRWSYYGEVRDGVGPLHDAQNATHLAEMKRLAGDANQMAIVDPDGEIGPFDFSFWGASGPSSRQEYVRFLQKVRGLSLDGVSMRYFGKPGMYASWANVMLPDWRAFYGWTSGSVDLAGEWRFMRDQKLDGTAAAWSQQSFDDTGWVRLYYPGDALVYGLVTPDKPIWMRKTVNVPAGAFPGNAYLSIAPLIDTSVQVFVNGQLLGTLTPRYSTGLTYGQFDVTSYLAQSRTLNIALRVNAAYAPNGPIFLTSKPIEDFPTSNPYVNALRSDAMEFGDWSTAQGVASTLSSLRSIDSDRPIKVHAYSTSPWGWKTLAQYGGYSHHTGSGPSWTFTEPHELGASRDLQDSSETGASIGSLRDLKGLFGNLIFMGKNAFDYFHDLQSITKDPEMRAWLEQRVPDIKVMGRASAMMSSIGEIKGWTNWRYLGETARWDEWRYDIFPVRGGEMIPFLDEVRIREGNLTRYAAIIDPGTQCWDAQETAALRAYVEAGGILVLNSLSGQDSFERQGNGAGPGAALAGVRLGPPPHADTSIVFLPGQNYLPGLNKFGRVFPRPGTPSHTLIPIGGTDTIGTWADGTPALTHRAMGKGAVYYCGGNTYPGDVIIALTNAYGPSVYATVDRGGGVDLIRTLRSNNGCEDLLMLRGLGNKPAVVHWTFNFTPTSIYNPVTGQSIDAQIDGHTASFSVNIPDWDFAWFAARRPNADNDFSRWFVRQTQMWSGFSEPVTPPAVPLFRHLDLNHGWKLVQTNTLDHAKALMAQSDTVGGFVPTELLPSTTPGMNIKTEADVVNLYRKEFDLPAYWTSDSTLDLVVHGQVSGLLFTGWSGKSTIYINGSPIWTGERLLNANIDVSSLLKPAHNRLEIVYQGAGLMPSIVLERSAKPDSVIDLAGQWRAVDDLQKEHIVTLPGTLKSAFVYRDVTIPASVRGQDVWVRVDGSSQFVVVNGRVRYWDMGGSAFMTTPGCQIDISPDIRPGQVNRIALGSVGMFGGWRPQDLHYEHVDLAVYSPGKWSASGANNRDALTPAELAQVAQDLGTVKLYPMIHAGSGGAGAPP